MKHVNKLNEAHAIVKGAKNRIGSLDALKLSVGVRSEIAPEMAAAYEALEFLRVKIQSLALQQMQHDVLLSAKPKRRAK